MPAPAPDDMGQLDALRPNLRGLSFVCPDCRLPLTRGAQALDCPGCRARYRILDSRPDFIGAELAPAPSAGATAAGGIRGWLARLPPHPARWDEEVESGITNDNGTLRRYLEPFKRSGEVLDLGSGARRLAPGIVTSDIQPWPEVDVIADAHRLPFADATFAGLVLQSVIEHVVDPIAVLQEARRVLKVGGTAYVEAPFLYPEHDEADYRRWTRKGLELEVGRFFEVAEAGLVMGPASALSLVWRSFLEHRLHRIPWGVRNLAAWSTGWVRDLDRRRSPQPPVYAAAYVVGRVAR